MTAVVPIADAHVHFWDIEHNSYPWLAPAEPLGPFGRSAAIRRTYLLDNYLTDASRQNVTRMVHVEAGWDRSDPLGEIIWIQAMADKHGAPHAHIAHIDLASDRAASLLTAHAGFPLFRGVRDRLQDGDFTKSDGANTRISDPAWLAGLKMLDAHGLCFDLQCPPALADKAANLASTFTGINFILTHAGYPPASNSDSFTRWTDGMAKLAECPNVAVKLSGLMLAEKAWHPEHARKAAHTLLAQFGPGRVLVASNFPVDRLFAPLDSLFGTYRQWVSHLPEEEQRKILHDNTCRIYCLEP